MNCCMKQLNCCFGPYPCFVCCLRNVRESTTTRLCYSLILVLVTFLSIASHEGGLLSLLYKYCEMDSFCEFINAGTGCVRLIGFISVYRICLPLFIFHLLLTLLTIGVSSSRSIRGKLHNGFWLWKVLFLVSVWITAYFFPILERQVNVWMLVGVIGGLIFTYIQHITLIDFAYEVNGNWHFRSENSYWFTFAIYMFTSLLYVGTFTAYTVFVIRYGLPHKCNLNLIVIFLNAGATLLFAICSLFSDTLRRRHMWLPGAITSTFVMFLTWSALGSQPRILTSHVPWQLSTADHDVKQFTPHPWIIVADHLNRLLNNKLQSNQISNHTVLINLCLPKKTTILDAHLSKDIFTITGILVVICGSLYSSFRATMQAKRIGIRTRRSRLKALLLPVLCEEADAENNSAELTTVLSTRETDRQEEQVVKNYNEMKNQMRALELLADAVANLPNPKAFRRPSARQPSIKQFGRSHASQSPPKPNDADSLDIIRPQDNHVALKLASSEPDLTITLRQGSRKRVDVRHFDWSTPAGKRECESAFDKKSNKSSCQQESRTPRIGYLRYRRPKRQAKVDEALEMDDVSEFDAVCRENLLNNDPVRNTHTSNVDEQKQPKAMRHVQKLDEQTEYQLDTSHKRIIAELYLLSSDSLPENVGSNTVLSLDPTPDSPIPFINKISRIRAKSPKQSTSPITQPKNNFSCQQSGDTQVETHPPDHLLYQKAKWVSDMALSRHGSRLFEIKPDLANSLAFLAPMLNTTAPRDGLVLFNETIASVYSYPWFHFIYAVATLYLMTQLTNWYNPQISRVDNLSESWANMWMKLASSWLALLLYAWTIACPQLCCGRELGMISTLNRRKLAKIKSTTSNV